MLSVLLSFVVLFFGIWVYRFRARRQNLDRISSHFGSIPKHFLLGHCLDFNKEPEETFQALHRYVRDKGPNTVFWGIGNYIEIMISDPKDIETILAGKTSTMKSFTYNFLVPWLGKGLLNAEGTDWFRMRRTLTPSFHFKILEGFVDVFNAQNRTLIQILRREAESNSNREVEMYDRIAACALDNICETAMGVKMDTQEKPNQEYVLATSELVQVIFDRMFGLLNQYPTLWDLTPAARKQKRLIKVAHKFTNDVIRQRKTQLSHRSSVSDSEPDEFGIKTRRSFLDMLLQTTHSDGKPLSSEEVRQEVDTFMLAGHDTTASAISFAVYELALHPEVQEKVFQEQRLLLGDDLEAAPDYNHLQKMKYLEMVIKETLRLFPSAPIISRESVSEPTRISGCDIPPGIQMNICIYSLHRNPTIYPDPDSFNPERFTEDEASKRGPYDYVPFSAGSRNCIGQKFAMLEIKAVLSAIIRNFELTTTDRTKGFKFAVDLVLRPISGIYVGLQRRRY